MIRVSVVATGIDQAMAQRAGGARRRRRGSPSWRSGSAADNQRRSTGNVVEPLRDAGAALAQAPRACPEAGTGAFCNADAPSIAIGLGQGFDRGGDCRMPATTSTSVRSRPSLRSLSTRPRAGPDTAGARPAAFIPPPAERLPQRAPRMPRIDELPVPAQNEIRARRGELPQDDHPGEAPHVAVAAPGLGRARPPRTGRRSRCRRRDGAGQRSNVARTLDRPADAASAEPGDRVRKPVSEYARRPAPQGLDQHGRQSPVHNPGEEDQLDIPAFLRRQAN